jgi:hypothetical protein
MRGATKAREAKDRKNKADSKQGERTDLIKDKAEPASNFCNIVTEVQKAPAGNTIEKALRCISA